MKGNQTHINTDTYSNEVFSGNRVPPSDVDAEKAVLGAILLDRSAVSVAAELLEPEQFYSANHGKIFEAMLTLYGQGLEVDAITVREELRKRGLLHEVGGSMYLNDLVSSVATSANIEAHCQIVVEKAMLRKLIVVQHDGIKRAMESNEGAFDVYEETQKNIMDVYRMRDHRSAVTMMSAVIKANESLEKGMAGIYTGFYDFDKMTEGLHKGEFSIIAARPSIGKTSLALDVARHIAKTTPTGFFSLEMPLNHLVFRMDSQITGLPFNQIRKGALVREQWNLKTRADQQLAGLKLIIDDNSTLTPIELRAKLRRMIDAYGIEVAFVDFLQIMQGGGRFESREREVGYISENFKAIAKDLNIALVALSQLSRNSENRPKREPELSDLRDSGTLEQNAVNVFAIHRPEFYGELAFEDGTESAGRAMIKVLKQRNGPTGDIIVGYKKEGTTFYNLTPMNSNPKDEKVPF
ncbi:MAG: replicative DNA helicase [Bacteroidetes bacterium]|nr:replicative DNA helicase [Bacteroidota bacterium]